MRALIRARGSAADLQLIGTSALNVTAGKAAGGTIAAAGSAGRSTAVFCANELVALGLPQEMTRRGNSVPDDIAIVGCDALDFAAAVVPLSAMRQRRHQIGRTAAGLLLEEALEDEVHSHRQVIFQPELEIRRSSHAWSRPRRSRAVAATPVASEPAPDAVTR